MIFDKKLEQKKKLLKSSQTLTVSLKRLLLYEVLRELNISKSLLIYLNYRKSECRRIQLFRIIRLQYVIIGCILQYGQFLIMNQF